MLLRLHPSHSSHPSTPPHLVRLHCIGLSLPLLGGSLGQFAVLGHHFRQPQPGLRHACPNVAKLRFVGQRRPCVVWRFGLRQERRPRRPRHLSGHVGPDQSEASRDLEREIPRRQPLWPFAVRASFSVVVFVLYKSKSKQEASLRRKVVYLREIKKFPRFFCPSLIFNFSHSSVLQIKPFVAHVRLMRYLSLLFFLRVFNFSQPLQTPAPPGTPTPVRTSAAAPPSPARRPRSAANCRAARPRPGATLPAPWQK